MNGMAVEVVIVLTRTEGSICYGRGPPYIFFAIYLSLLYSFLTFLL